nr:hypothetical protein [uncultured Flavobacterium sp.]
METKASTIELLFEKAEDYARTTAELTKLTVVDKSADVLSSLLSQMAIGVVVALFSLLINIGISLWLGELLGKTYYGFFIVSSCHLIFAILLYSYKRVWIKMPVSNFIIHKMLNNK